MPLSLSRSRRKEGSEGSSPQIRPAGRPIPRRSLKTQWKMSPWALRSFRVRPTHRINLHQRCVGRTLQFNAIKLKSKFLWFPCASVGTERRMISVKFSLVPMRQRSSLYTSLFTPLKIRFFRFILGPKY
jgi:hypothetical protein